MFEFGEHVKLALSFLINSSFSNEECSCCGKRIYYHGLCRDCSRELMNFKPMGNERCSICGKELLSEDGKCTSCRVDPIIISAESVFPLYSYRAWNKKLVFDWKMTEKRSLSWDFAKALDKALCGFCEDGKKKITIVPVPPRKGKIWKKGWDQVEELCSFLEKRYGYEIFRCLERVSSVQQKKLDREGRVSAKGKNYILGSNFDCYVKKYGIPEEVVLLDDVITTGVTVESCAFLLKNAGIRKVHIVSLFIVD